jgi:shikimate dehydrogenase
MVGMPKLNRNILNLVSSSKSVIDIIYNPIITDLLKRAIVENKKNIGGLKMLIEQAKPSFEKWTGKKITIDKELYKIIEQYI